MKEDNSLEEVKEIFSDYLTKKKHRKTPERFAILEHIYTHRGHFDAEMLYNMMQEDYRVSLATIYNTLDLLLDCSLILKHPFVGQTAQFEKTFGTGFHHHLVCSRCGSVKEFSDMKIRRTLQAKKFASFETTHYSLYLYGICSKCRKEMNSKKNK